MRRALADQVEERCAALFDTALDPRLHRLHVGRLSVGVERLLVLLLKGTQEVLQRRDSLPLGVSVETAVSLGHCSETFVIGSKRTHSKISISVAKGERPIYFTGIVAKEVRAGYGTLGMPPLEW